MHHVQNQAILKQSSATRLPCFLARLCMFQAQMAYGRTYIPIFFFNATCYSFSHQICSASSRVQPPESNGFHPADFDEKLFPGRRIVFIVDRSWKGVETSSVMIRTGYNTQNPYGYPFEVGSYYLVYASHAYGDPEKYLLTSKSLRYSRTSSGVSVSKAILQIFAMFKRFCLYLRNFGIGEGG